MVRASVSFSMAVHKERRRASLSQITSSQGVDPFPPCRGLTRNAIFFGSHPYVFMQNVQRSQNYSSSNRLLSNRKGVHRKTIQTSILSETTTVPSVVYPRYPSCNTPLLQTNHRKKKRKKKGVACVHQNPEVKCTMKETINMSSFVILHASSI